ncbi:MAG: fumarylacetoacetate hydrolase family protein [Myxococcota bacterium]
MQLCRTEYRGVQHWAVIEEDDTLTLLHEPPFAGLKRAARGVPVESTRFLAPATPSKIVCIGLNYRQHAEEMGKSIPEEPRIFLKAPSSLLDPAGVVLLPDDSHEVEHEGELAVIIGRTATRVSERDALDCVLGYTCLNDVTARDVQRREKIYGRAKGYDTFCPMGPWIETEVEDPQDLAIEVRVGRSVRQKGSTSDMIFPVAALISFVSRVMTLLPGDVLSTGTPAGVGPLVAGDRVEVEISTIGTLQHRVARLA